MADANSLQIRILVDSSQIQTAMPAAAAAVESATQQMATSFGPVMRVSEQTFNNVEGGALRARESVALLGEEFGVKVPRALRGTIAQTELLGAAMSAAFPAFAAIAFIEILSRAGKELFNFYENVVNLKSELEALDAIEKTLTQDLLSLSNALIQGHERLTKLTSGPIAAAKEGVASFGLQITDLGKLIDVSGKQFNDLGAAAKSSLREFLVPTQAKDLAETLKNVGLEIGRVKRLLLQTEEGTTEYKSLQEALRGLSSFYDVLSLKVQKYNQDVMVGTAETQKAIRTEREKAEKEAERLAKEQARATHERVIAELDDEGRLAKEKTKLLEEEAKEKRELSRNVEEEEKRLDSELVSIQKKGVTEAIRNQEKLLREQDRLAKEAQRPWLQLGHSITSGFDQMIHGVLMGTQTIGQAFSRLGADMLIIMAQALAKIYLKHLAHWLAVNILEKVALTQSIGTMVAGLTAKKAIQTASAVSQVTSDAGVAGAAGFASVMEALPFPANVAVAPGVMAAAIATTLGNLALASAAGGWDMVPSGGALTRLHAREMVLSAPVADAVRAGVGNGSPAGGGEIHIHYAANVHAIDSRGMKEALEGHGATIVKLIEQEVRNFRGPALGGVGTPFRLDSSRR